MRWLLYTGIGSVFLLGGVAGGMLGVTSEREKLKKLEREPSGVMELMGRRLDRELELDPGQSREIRAIYSEVRPELHRMERERRQRVREIMEGVNPRIAAVLRPEQRTKFEELQKNLHTRLRLREHGPGGGGERKDRDKQGGPRLWKERPKSPADATRAREKAQVAPPVEKTEEKSNP